MNNGRTGIGKSHDKREEIKANDKKPVVSASSKALANEYKGVIPNIIHSDTSNRVYYDVNRALANITFDGMVITHNALIKTYKTGRNIEGELVLDEALTEVLKYTGVDVRIDNREFLKKLIKPIKTERYVELTVNPDVLEEVKDNLSEIDYWKGFSNNSSLADTLLSDAYLCVTSHEEWFKFTHNVKNKNGNTNLGIISMLRKEVINADSIQYLSADGELTEFGRVLQYQGQELLQTNSDDDRIHNNDTEIVIHYVSKIDDWSERLRESQESRYAKPAYRLYAEYANKTHFSKLPDNESFIWNSNEGYRKELEEEVFLQPPQVAVEGVNLNTDDNAVTHAFWVASRNVRPDFGRVLDQIGLPSKYINYARNKLAVYQFVSRCSFRTPNNNKPNHFWITDKTTVDYLLEKFPKAKVVYESINLAFQTGQQKPKGVTDKNWEMYLDTVSYLNRGGKVKDALALTGIARKSFYRIKALIEKQNKAKS